MTEGAETVIGLVEARLASFQGLLDHRSPDFFLFATFLEQGLDRFNDQVQCLLLLVVLDLCAVFLAGLFRHRLAPCAARFLGFAYQVVIEDKIVAIGNQQVGGGTLDANPDNDLVVLAVVPLTSGEPPESPLMITKVSTCDLV